MACAMDGAEQALLVAETCVDRADGDVGALADFLDGERVEALLLEQLDRGVEHALERLAGSVSASAV